MTDPRYPIGRFAPPADYHAEARAGYIAAVEALPGQLRAAVAGLSVEQLATPYREGGWMVAQVVHHVADSHMNAYMRFKLAATMDHPLVTAYNEAQWAECADARSLDIEVSLSLLDCVHERLVRFLRSLDASAFDRTLEHSANGPMSLNRLLALYAWHGRHHTAHITGLRQQKGW